MKGFNPTFGDYGKIIEYKIAEKVNKGLVDS
jgi:hypothetical protein